MRRGTGSFWLIAAVLALSGHASADSIVAPFEQNDPTARIWEIANYLAANYGIFLDFTDTSPQNLALIEGWYILLLPGLVPPLEQISTERPIPLAIPEPGTAALAAAALTALIIGIHVSLRHRCQPRRNRLHPEDQRPRAGPAGASA